MSAGIGVGLFWRAASQKFGMGQCAESWAVVGAADEQKSFLGWWLQFLHTRRSGGLFGARGLCCAGAQKVLRVSDWVDEHEETDEQKRLAGLFFLPGRSRLALFGARRRKKFASGTCAESRAILGVGDEQKSLPGWWLQFLRSRRIGDFFGARGYSVQGAQKLNLGELKPRPRAESGPEAKQMLAVGHLGSIAKERSAPAAANGDRVTCILNISIQ